MVGAMDDPVGLMSAQLKIRGIVIPRDNEWLNGCVECFVSSNPNISQDQLFHMVFEQWTLADLNDVRAPTLPPSCSSCNKMVLTGKYAVQINYFLNVAVPLHKQLQKIRRPSAQNNLEVDSDRQERERDRFKEQATVRALKMEITDGVTTVIGFEDQSIPSIKNPIPGEKAVLSGPIEVRKGVMMLKPANVTMLGGEVDTLLVKNATENLLARALRQPENPDPYGMNPALRESTPLTHQVTRAPEAPPHQAPRALEAPPHQAPRAPEARPVASQPPPRTPPASAPFHDPFDDGDDEALASLAEALENDSFHSVESPVNRSTTTNIRKSTPPTPQPAMHVRSTSKSNISKPSRTATSQKPTKQPSITNFLSQAKKPSSSQVFDVSSELDDGFDDDFELIAAQTASLAEQRASKTSVENHDPEKLKAQLAASYAVSKDSGATATSRANAGVCGRPNLTTTNKSSEKPPDSRQPNKRKEPAVELDIFGRPKIARNESNPSSSSSSEAQPFKNPRRLPQDELMDSEELHDWLPPPPKANLEHVRPSHEKGKILVDYTDPSTLDLDLISTQKSLKERSTQKKPTASSVERQRTLEPDPLTTEKHPNPKPASSLEEPFPPKEFPCTRTTTGKVVKIVNKLQLREAKWALSAIVEAKGIELEMDFAPEALDKIFTVTAEEVTRQKEQLKKNPELKEKFNAQLRESQKRIQTLHCDMTIHFKNFISKPVVLDVSKND